MSAEEVKGDRSQQQQLLRQFADAVRARDAHTLTAYTSTAALGSGVQRVLASRVIAGVWDANTVVLHDLATKLVTQAHTSRCVTCCQPGKRLGLSCCSAIARNLDLTVAVVFHPQATAAAAERYCCCCSVFCAVPRCFVLQFCSMQAAAATQVIEQNFAPAVQASLARMRNMIESSCYNLKRQEVKRAAVAGRVDWMWCF
jgi:hypothetical protein